MAVASPIKEKIGSVEQSLRSSPSRAAKQDTEAASETSSVHSGDPSDRREFDILTQVFSARSEEYRLLFRLPSDEVLIQDFNCALQENILLQGHMYLFLHHICFYSNIFGFETKKTIPFHEITDVRKAKTAAIFPNAIEIVAGEKKHFFGSFLSRDEAHRLIIDGWSQHSSDVKAFVDCQETKSDNTSQDNLVMLERLRGSKEPIDCLSSSARNKDNVVNISEEYKPLSNGNGDISPAEKLSEVQENGGENVDRLSLGTTFTWQLEDADAPNIPEYFTVVAEAQFPVHVEGFFDLFISDGAADFLLNVHTRCGDKDFQCSPWHPHDQCGHARDLSFLHPVKLLLGGKFGHCREIQKLRVYRNSHLVIESSQKISDVPFADCFNVEGIWDVEQDANEESCCILRVYSNVAFLKKTIWKGKIERSTREELREVYGIWINNAHELLKQKNMATLQGVVPQNSKSVQVNDVGSDSPSKLEGPSVKLHATTTTKTLQIVPDSNPRIDNPVEESLGSSTSMASILRESWATFCSYFRRHNLPMIMVVAFVAILMIMQISIIVLLTRVPEVHLVTQGNYMDNLGNDRSETIQWLEKRFYHLNEEMLLMETRMERMRHEYALLKVHLQSLERLKPKS